MKKSTYVKFPSIAVPSGKDVCVAGWEECIARLKKALAQKSLKKTVFLDECYPGVDENTLTNLIHERLSVTITLRAKDAMRSVNVIDKLVEPFLGGDDPVFGFLCGLTLPDFFDADRLQHMRNQLSGIQSGVVLIIGCGS